MAERFGGYTLVERIGVGGMAEVFLARHSGVAGFEKDIVIKRIRNHLTEQPSFIEMFLGEAKLAAQLSHPNIVQIYDLGKIHDAYFIAMEYVAGRDLSAVIPKCRDVGIPFPIEYALKISSNLCEALHYAHTKADPLGSPLSIVHRDVSPENIRIGWNGAVKILDFGIAKAATQLHETQAGQIKGKISYMSPEQVMGKDIDRRSDIFSLGIVLYETMTGLRLFSGDTDMAIMSNIVEGKIYPPSYFRADIPKDVEAIILKALEKDRRRRYDSATDMQFDIDSFLAGHEFTPSNVHLSNFLKQLFKEELEQEQERRARQTTSERNLRYTAGQRAKAAGRSAHGDVIDLYDEVHTAPQDDSTTAAEPLSKGSGRVALRDGLQPKDSDLSGVADGDEDEADIDEGVAYLEQSDGVSIDTGRSLLLSFDPGQLEALERLAKRRETSAEALIRAIIADFLKYH
jgi:serine/threonine-protein kinase